MTKRAPSVYDPTKLIEAISKWPNPMFDKKHNLYIYVEGRARSNQTRAEKIANVSHELEVRDIDLIPEAIKYYMAYRKDLNYEDTYNYYLKRNDKDNGLIKMSVRIDPNDKTKAYIKTIYVTYSTKGLT